MMQVPEGLLNAQHFGDFWDQIIRHNTGILCSPRICHRTQHKHLKWHFSRLFFIFDCSLKTYLDTTLYTFICIYMHLYNWKKMGLLFKELFQTLGKSQHKMVSRDVCEQNDEQIQKNLRKNVSFCKKAELAENLEAREKRIFIPFCLLAFLGRKQLNLFSANRMQALLS